MLEVRKNRILQTDLKYSRQNKEIKQISFDNDDLHIMIKKVNKEGWPTFFEAAVKAWRIEDVQKIEITNQDLTDEEVLSLTNGFLKFTKNIQILKLSNNKISD